MYVFPGEGIMIEFEYELGSVVESFNPKGNSCLEFHNIPVKM